MDKYVRLRIGSSFFNDFLFYIQFAIVDLLFGGIWCDMVKL